MIDIRYFLARQKKAQDAARPPRQKEAPKSSLTRQAIPAWAGLRYLGLPDEAVQDESAFDLTKQNHLENLNS